MSLCARCLHPTVDHVGREGACTHRSYGESPETSMRIVTCDCPGYRKAESPKLITERDMMAHKVSAIFRDRFKYDFDGAREAAMEVIKGR